MHMTDVILDQGANRDTVELDAHAVKVTGSDFILDKAEHRKSSAGFRRALVHETGDVLILNYNQDYPGGVVLNGIAELTPHQTGSFGGLVPALVVRGGISFELATGVATLGPAGHGGSGRTTVNLAEELEKLNARIAALEAKK